MLKLEPVLVLLAALVVFFAVLLISCAHFFPTDGQTFQVISGLVTGFSGALLMRVKPRGDPMGSSDPKDGAVHSD